MDMVLPFFVDAKVQGSACCCVPSTHDSITTQEMNDMVFVAIGHSRGHSAASLNDLINGES